MEQQLLRFPTIPACLIARSSMDWRVWGRRMHAVVHQCAPTRKWRHHKRRAESMDCDRCSAAAAGGLVPTDDCRHAFCECPSTAEVRQIAFDAVLAALTSPAALRLHQRGLLRDLQLDAVLAAPVPTVLLSGHARRCLSTWDPAMVADANNVIAAVAAAQRELALGVWRVVCNRPANALDDNA